MLSFFKRCLNSALRRFGFFRLYQLKCKLTPHTRLHRAFIKLFTFYPGVLLYFERQEEELLIFPHQPQHLDTTSKEAQQLYHMLNYTSENHANRH